MPSPRQKWFDDRFYLGKQLLKQQAAIGDKQNQLPLRRQLRLSSGVF